MRSCASMSGPQIPDKNRRELYRSLQARSTAPNARAGARPSCEVMKIGDFSITQRAEELDTTISLIIPMFHQQTAARQEPGLRARSNLPDAAEPVFAAD